MKGDTFGTMKGVVDEEGEIASLGIGVESGTRKVRRGNKLLDGTWGDNGGSYLRCVVTKDWDISQRVGSRELKDSIADGGIGFSIGWDHTSLIGPSSSEHAVAMEV